MEVAGRHEIDDRLARVRAHPDYLTAMASRPRRRGDVGELVGALVILTLTAGIIVAFAFVPVRAPVAAMPFIAIFAAMGAATLKIALDRRSAPMIGEPAVVLEVVALEGRVTHRRALLGRAGNIVVEVRDYTRGGVRRGAAGVAHRAGNVLYAFIALD